MKNSLGYLLVCLLLIASTSIVVGAQEPEFPTPPKRTLVADVLDVEGEYIIVRGELGEIRIEVTGDTKISEEFQFGDRVIAVLRPNDTAISVLRATGNEPTGFQKEKADQGTASKKLPSQAPAPREAPAQSGAKTDAPPAPENVGPTMRIIVADLLMVDGDFYVVRNSYGEIRIEATPDTKVTESFDFGDRIKAKVLPNDRALFIERAKPEDPIGIQVLEPRKQSTNSRPVQTQANTSKPKSPATKTAKTKFPKDSRTIVADVLMVDGDFIIVRGERGEIQIEVTPKTKITETFDYGDKIKAIVLANDKAVSVERADSNEPIGITKH